MRNIISITRVLAKEGSSSGDLTACAGCIFRPAVGSMHDCIRVTEIMVQQGLGDCSEVGVNYIYVRGQTSE